MKTEIEKVNPEEFGLNQKEVSEIEKAFLPKIAEREGYEVMYKVLITKEINAETCAEAATLRKKLVKTRTGIAAIHKAQKAYFLAAGKFVDKWKNKETLPIQQMEDNLAEIETYYERLKAEKIKKLEEVRTLEVAKYSEVIPGGLGAMKEDVYNNYLAGCKALYDAKIKAEKEAEAERIRLAAEAEKAAKLKEIEDEKIRKENARLKKLAAEKERKLKIARKAQDDILAKQKAESKKKDDAIKQAQEENKRLKETFSNSTNGAALLKKQEDIESKSKALNLLGEENKKLAAKAAAEHKQAMELQKKIAAAEQKKIDDAKKAKAEADKAAKAPDKVKLVAWVDGMNINIPDIKDKKAQTVAFDIFNKFLLFQKWSKEQIAKI